MPTCKGTTLSGQPCERQIKIGKEYCWQHSPKVRWRSLLGIILAGLGILAAIVGIGVDVPQLLDDFTNPESDLIIQDFVLIMPSFKTPGLKAYLPDLIIDISNQGSGLSVSVVHLWIDGEFAVGAIPLSKNTPQPVYIEPGTQKHISFITPYPPELERKLLAYKDDTGEKIHYKIALTTDRGEYSKEGWVREGQIFGPRD